MNKLAVFGNPIAHSLSPQLHAEFARLYNITIDYQKILTPLGEFKKTVDAFRAFGGVGANITAPFKFEAYEYCDALTERAKQTHTVNTFIFKNNRCIGDNTDGIGFINDLTKKQFNCFEKNILILGAGGATQGILGELIAQKPNKIYIENRTPEKIKKIIDFFAPQFQINFYQDRTEIDLLINAVPTRAGCRQRFCWCQKTPSCADQQHSWHLKNNPTEALPAGCALNMDLSNTICYDLNYGERHHAFSDWAKKNNARVIYGGLGMLVEQGRMSFSQWFGKTPNASANSHACT